MTPVIASVLSHYSRVRAGLVVGFNDDTMDILKAHRDGVWLNIPFVDQLPYDDRQFEVVVVNGNCINKNSAHEANRVLKPDGCLFFTVNERTSKQEGFTAPEIYRIIREGFDIIEIVKPKWWTFGLKGRIFTVCARKKAWREHKGFLREGSMPFAPFRTK